MIRSHVPAPAAVSVVAAVLLAIPHVPANAGPPSAEVIIHPAPLGPESEIGVRFDTAMVDAEAVGQAAAESPVVVDPPLDAVFRWQSRSSGRLDLAAAPRPATLYRFRLRDGLSDAAGEPVPSGELVSVRSEGFSLLDRLPRHISTYNTPRLPRFLFQFTDTPPAPADAAGLVYFIDDSGNRVEAAITAITGADAQGAGFSRPSRSWEARFTAARSGAEEVDGSDPGPVLAAEPVHPLPVGKNWRVVLEEGLPNARNDARLETALAFKVGDIERMEVRSIHGESLLDAPREIHVGFNKTLDETTPDELLFKHVEVTPEPPELVRVRRGSGIVLRGKFDLQRPYEIVVRPGVAADDGTALPEASVEKVVFAPHPAVIEMPSFDAVERLDGAGGFELVCANLESVQFRVKRLARADLIPGLRGYQVYTGESLDDGERKRRGRSSTFERIPYPLIPGKTIFERTLTCTEAIDVSDRFEIPWSEILGVPGEEPAALVITAEGVPKRGVEDRRTFGAQSLIQITNIGIAAKFNEEQAVVFAFSHATGQPIDGAIVWAFDDENTPLAEAVTADGGVAEVAVRDARWLMVEKDGDRHAMQIGEGRDTLATWRFGGQTNRPAREVDSHGWSIFTDRPVYRPGETVHFFGVQRVFSDSGLVMPPEEDVTLTLRSPEGHTVLERTLRGDRHGTIALDFTAPEGRLGRFGLQLATESGGTFYDSILVEEFTPNLFEVDFDPEATVVESGRLGAVVGARYLMGRPLAGAVVRWTLDASADGYFPPGGPAAKGFSYGDDARFGGYQDSRRHRPPSWTFSGETAADDEGRASIDSPLPDFDDIDDRIALTLRAEVTGPGGQTLVESISRHADPVACYLGFRPKPGSRPEPGQPFELEFTAVVPESGEPLDAPLTAEVIVERQEWVSVRTSAAGRQSAFESRPVLTEVHRGGISVTPPTAEGAWPSLSFVPPESGQYWITVRATDPEGHSVLTRGRLSIYGSGADSGIIALRDGLPIELEADREHYRVGDTARILVRSPAEGTALVTLERSNVRRHFTTEIARGNSILEIPLTETDTPNVYVSVLLVRGAEANAPGDDPSEAPPLAGEPSFHLGYVDLQVDNPALAAEVELQLASTEVEPGEEIAVTAIVRDHEARPVAGARVVLYAVDEGILELAGYRQPDPAADFSAARVLGVECTTSLGDLLVADPEKRQFANKGYVAGGGGVEGGGEAGVRRQFKACAYWNAALESGPDGRVTVSFPAPDNLSRFRVIAVAVAGTERFATAADRFTVRKSLMIEPALPRFANAGDEMLARAVVHNNTGRDARFQVTLDVTGEGAGIRERDSDTVVARASRELEIADGRLAVTALPVTFASMGTVKFTWDVVPLSEAPAGDAAPAFRDTVEGMLEVGSPVPLLGESRFGRLAPTSGPADLLAGVSPDLLEGRGTVTVTFSTSPLLEAIDAIDHLLHYPYGCVEQTTSSFLPWLAVSSSRHQLPGLDRSDEEVAEAVAAGVARLLSMQTRSGGLAYWPGGSSPDFWGSCYGGFGLAMASKAGVAVPEDRLAPLRRWLAGETRKRVEDQADRTTALADAAFALLTLAMTGEPDHGLHEVLFRERETLPPLGKALLAMAILEGGHAPAQPLADALLVELDAPSKASPDWRYWIGPSFGNAVALLAHRRHGDDELADALAATLLKSRGARGDWGSTFANAWAVLALSDRDPADIAPPSADFAVEWNGAESRAIRLDAESPSWRSLMPFDGTADEARAPSLAVRLDSGHRLYTHVEVEARPAALDTRAINRGLGIERRYQRVEPDGTTAPADSLAIGDLVAVRLVVDLPESLDYIVIDDPLPASFEAVNPEFGSRGGGNDAGRLALEGGPARLYCDHRELRTDRALFFVDHLRNPGRYRIEYVARVVAAGSATAPPARIEAMYDRQRFGLSDSARVVTTTSDHGSVAGR